MTIEEFNKIRWRPNMVLRIYNVPHIVTAVDFVNKRVGYGFGDRIHWVRCGNVELV